MVAFNLSLLFFRALHKVETKLEMNVYGVVNIFSNNYIMSHNTEEGLILSIVEVFSVFIRYVRSLFPLKDI